MSAEILHRICNDFAAQVAGLDRVDDPMGLLSEFIAALARHTAEFIFLKVQTEPGWDQEQAQALADETLHDQIIILTDTLHAHGSTVEIAQELARVTAIAYGTRLADLSASFGRGGAA